MTSTTAPAVATTHTVADDAPAPKAATPNVAAVQAPAAPAPVAPAVAPVAVTATAAAAPVAAPPAAEQIVSVLRPLRTSPDGSYRIRLELRPPELGRIELRVEMRDGVLSASLHTDNEGAAQTLHNALGDLRLRLEAGGVRAGELSVDSGRAGDRQGNARNDATPRNGEPFADGSDPTIVLPDASSATTDTALDVRL
jgi:flagellar hook-length control protein FliK